jgi:hypothetical protein
MQDESIYKELRGIYDKSVMSGRVALIYRRAEAFLDEIGATDIAVVNENVLCHLVLDYFADIVRLKQFHRIRHTNKEKIIAYTAYWVYRRKPIQLIKKRVDDKFTFINEGFITSIINEGVSKLLDGEDMPESLKAQVFYHLKYRLLDAQSLELMIKSFVSKEGYNKGERACED